MAKNSNTPIIRFEEANYSKGSHKPVIWTCVGCKNEFQKAYKNALKTSLCKKCNNKIHASSRMDWTKGSGNPMYRKAPVKTPLPKCVNCSKQLSSRNSTRCIKCAAQNRNCTKVNHPPATKPALSRKEAKLRKKLHDYVRVRIIKAIKRGAKAGSAIKDLGCSVEEFKMYLESKFQPGMTWENWKLHGWHLDHIRPLSSFDLSNHEEFKKAVHYTNLQPMWANENLSKGDRFIP